MVGWGVLNYLAIVSDRDLVWTDAYVIDPYRYASSTRRSEFFAQAIFASLLSALCFPTVPYVIAMVCLGVALLATKRD